MKLKKIKMVALVVPLVFTACDKSEEVNSFTRQEVKIVATIDGVATPQLKAAFNADGSGEFEPGDEYSLFFWNPTLGMGSMGQFKIGRTILWWDEISQDGNPVDFKAWYPYYEFYGNTTRLYNVADAATEQAKDLLIAPKVTVTTGDHPVNLQFKHVMHKLWVNLTSDSYDVTQATITLKNLKSHAMVNFEEGTVDVTTAGGTGSYMPKTGTNTSFIIAPQQLAANTEFVEIVAGGKTFVYKVPSSLTALESGKQVVLTLTLKKGGGVDGYIGEDFNPGGGHDGWN